MSGDPGERTALKEWAILTRAMGDGDIIAMVRKGGIRERRAGFVVRHDRFVLYPTFFHEKEVELAERFRPSLAAVHEDRPPQGSVRIELLAEVVALWRIDDLERLDLIVGEHGLTPGAVASRFHYRNEPGVQVVVVRVARLPEPVEIREVQRYLGCVSWVELDEPIDTSGAIPVIPDADFVQRVRALEDALGVANSAC